MNWSLFRLVVGSACAGAAMVVGLAGFVSDNGHLMATAFAGLLGASVVVVLAGVEL